MHSTRASRSLRQSVATTFRILAHRFGPIHFRPTGRPLDELIASILSQNTSDRNSERAYTNLRRRFPRWEQVLEAPTSEVSRAIRIGGLSNIKAPRIQAILREIRKREGKLTLGRLRKLTTHEAMQYLTSLRGVGPKTASCVLLFALGRPVMPVDTHVHRVVRRLEWVDPRATPQKVQQVLEANVAAQKILPMHLYLVYHGRRFCKARNPRCSECPLRKMCKAYRRKTV